MAESAGDHKMSISQNIFDDPDFFSGYRELREGLNYNDLLEQPAMEALLPPLDGKRVLDIGCGYGRNCLAFSEKARQVVGIDISQRMLNVACKESSAANISYIRMDMAELSSLSGHFDFVYSSLAFHYCLDLERLMRDIYALLKPEGILLFSQEHPITTAAVNTEKRYIKDEEGNVFFKIADYQDEGLRHVRWFVDDVEHQHRKISSIVNAIVDSGLSILSCTEPRPDKAAIRRLPALQRETVKPSFIIFKCIKRS